MVNNQLIKQIDGIPMGDPMSVAFADIYICKMEDNVVAPVKPIFYKRYVDDTYVSRKNLLKINSLKNLTGNMTNFLDTYCET